MRRQVLPPPSPLRPPHPTTTSSTNQIQIQIQTPPPAPVATRPPLDANAQARANANSDDINSNTTNTTTVTNTYAITTNPFIYPPFRTRLGRPSARLLASSLWNPTNSTPRELGRRPRPPKTHTQTQTHQKPPRRQHPHPHTKPRPRRPSTPPPPPVPLYHPTLDIVAPIDPADPASSAAGHYPLLSLPEQRQTRHSTSIRASLQADRAGSDRLISLPRSLRHSYDGNVAETSTSPAFPPPPPRALDKGKGKAIMDRHKHSNKDMKSGSTDQHAPEKIPPPRDGDLERGPDVLPDADEPRRSMASGIGSAISSDDDSSIMGDPDQATDFGLEWGPQHPCYPHLNPHVPVASPEHVNTRIIRIRRDWMLEGDLAPTFSNLYPEILDPAGLPEQEFRRVIEKINDELVPAFDPYGLRNVVDGVMGLVTGWLWEDFGLTGTKLRLRRLEKWIEQWNADMEKAMDSYEGAVPPKLIPLRQTAYMSLDIRIGDPEIAPAQIPDSPAAMRATLASEEPRPNQGPS